MSTPPILSVSNLSKTYASGFQALKHVNLDIRPGEIFALLGPNGAGKTTLIGSICGIVTPTDGRVTVGGHDIRSAYRAARELIGLVPQELTTDAFETVWATVSFSRGLFGKAPNPAHIEKTLKALSLWDKRDNKLMTLSGGMKRRVMIAKALSHEPRILFLDEPTAGVDVELRQTLWKFISRLNREGHTIVLTTHYLEEAESLCDRIAMLRRGEVVALDRTDALLQRFAGLQLYLRLAQGALPHELRALESDPAARSPGEHLLRLANYDEVERILAQCRAAGCTFDEIEVRKADLEDVFVQVMNGAGVLEGLA